MHLAIPDAAPMTLPALTQYKYIYTSYNSSGTVDSRPLFLPYSSITISLSLFAALIIAVDKILRDSGPLGDSNATFAYDKDTLTYFN